MVSVINGIWESIDRLLDRPITGFLNWLEPYWYTLARHDKYVYLFIVLLLAIWTLLQIT